MAAPKRKTGNALGLTGGKARSSYALRGKPTKPSIQVDHDDKVAHKALVPPAEERTYPKALLKLAEGCPDLDVNSPKYDKLWEETKNIIGSKASTCFLMRSRSPWQRRQSHRPDPAGFRFELKLWALYRHDSP